MPEEATVGTETGVVGLGGAGVGERLTGGAAGGGDLDEARGEAPAAAVAADEVAAGVAGVEDARAALAGAEEGGALRPDVLAGEDGVELLRGGFGELRLAAGVPAVPAGDVLHQQHRLGRGRRRRRPAVPRG